MVTGTFRFDFARTPIKILETSELKIAIDIVEQLTGNIIREDEVYNSR